MENKLSDALKQYWRSRCTGCARDGETCSLLFVVSGHSGSQDELRSRSPGFSFPGGTMLFLQVLLFNPG